MPYIDCRGHKSTLQFRWICLNLLDACWFHKLFLRWQQKEMSSYLIFITLIIKVGGGERPGRSTRIKSVCWPNVNSQHSIWIRRSSLNRCFHSSQKKTTLDGQGSCMKYILEKTLQNLKPRIARSLSFLAENNHKKSLTSPFSHVVVQLKVLSSWMPLTKKWTHGPSGFANQPSFTRIFWLLVGPQMRFLFGKMVDFLTLNLEPFGVYNGNNMGYWQEHLDSWGDPVLHFNFSLPMKKRSHMIRKGGRPSVGWVTLPETNIAPENRWLEDVYISYWNSPFLGDMLVVSVFGDGIN